MFSSRCRLNFGWDFVSQIFIPYLLSTLENSYLVALQILPVPILSVPSFWTSFNFPVNLAFTFQASVPLLLVFSQPLHSLFASICYFPFHFQQFYWGILKSHLLFLDSILLLSPVFDSFYDFKYWSVLNLWSLACLTWILRILIGINPLYSVIVKCWSLCICFVIWNCKLRFSRTLSVGLSRDSCFPE